MEQVNEKQPNMCCHSNIEDTPWKTVLEESPFGSRFLLQEVHIQAKENKIALRLLEVVRLPGSPRHPPASKVSIDVTIILSSLPSQP